MGEVKRVHVFVSGRVQGVGYRYFVERAARNLRLTGWVRNLPDERVETVAEGDEAALRDFLGRLKDGPAFAYVADLAVEWEAGSGDFLDFEVVSFR